MKISLVFVLLLGLSGMVWAQSEASQLLKKADLAMFPQNAEFKWTMTVKKAGDPDKINKLLGWKKGDLKYMFFNVWPDATYGQVDLRIDNTIWSYLPLADDTVKTSYKSAFLGSGLSYADVMYNELSLYYNSKIITDSQPYRTEGTDYDTEILELTAKPGADGYARMLCTIDKRTLVTLKREYFSTSGQKLKVITYSQIQFQGGQLVAMTLEVVQPLLPGQKTIATFFDIQPKSDVKDQYFSLNYIKTLQPHASW